MLLQKSSWQSIIVDANYPEGWGDQHLPTIKRKLQPRILEFTSIPSQYGGGPDERFLMQVVTYNLGSLGGKGGEVCEELRKQMIDVCCLQEVR